MPITEEMKAGRDQRKEVARGPGLHTDKLRDPNAPDNKEMFHELEWPLLRKMLGWMLPYKTQYTIALLLSVVFTILEMLGPMFIRQLIDHDVKGEPHFLARALTW